MCEGRSFSRYHLHYPEKTSVIPVYLLSLNAGYVKTYTAASASVLHFCFQFPCSLATFCSPPSEYAFQPALLLRLCISLCQRRSAYSSYSTPLPCSYYNEIFFFCQDRDLLFLGFHIFPDTKIFLAFHYFIPRSSVTLPY